MIKVSILSEYEKFVEMGRTQREYEDLGNHLVEHILNHVGMLRYDKSKMKDFDLDGSEVGLLTDTGIGILKGINGEMKEEQFKRHITTAIEYVDEMGLGSGDRSVKESLKNAFKNEIRRRVVQNIDYNNLWEL